MQGPSRRFWTTPTSSSGCGNPDDAPIPERFKPLLDDALERARLGYLALIMSEQYAD